MSSKRRIQEGGLVDDLPVGRPLARRTAVGNLVGSIVVLFALLAAAALAQGCAEALKSLQSAPHPTANLDAVRIGSLSLTKVGLLLDVRVANPYAVDLPLADLDYALSSGATPFLSGRTATQGSVPASGARVVTVPVDVDLLELLHTIGSIRPGNVVPYEVSAGITVDPPVLEPIRLPLSASGQLPIPAVPSLAVSGIRWKKLGLDQIDGTLSLSVHNPNAFSLALNGLSYALDLAGTSVASAQASPAASIDSGATRMLELPLSFSPAAAGIALVRALSSSSSSYALKGDLNVGTPFGALSMPFDASGQTPLVR